MLNDKFKILEAIMPPMTPEEMSRLGWKELDILLVSGDGYVDHPAFGIAVIARVLLAAGYRVGVIAQPDWRTKDDFERLGRPRLFAGIGAGAVDSMMNLFTAAKKKRRDDVYSPGGRGGMRPEKTTIVYANRLRECFGNLPIIAGGIEASLRRFPHYDYWKDSIRRSIVLDARLDAVVYGHGEKAIVEIAERIDGGEGLAGIPGTAINIPLAEAEQSADGVTIPDYSEIVENPALLVPATRAIERELQPWCGRPIIAPHSDRAVVSYPPQEPLTEAEFDAISGLPFSRRQHPSYAETIPALEPVLFSVGAVRGCSGGCSFCSLTIHQGKFISSRSIDSILREVEVFTSDDRFRGTITDIGGPTANLWGAGCLRPDLAANCRRPSCLYPKRCRFFGDSQERLPRLYQLVEKIRGVKNVFVASGIRHDLAIKSDAYLLDLVGRRTGGHLKVAPEHISPTVLKLMRKPGFGDFEKFVEYFYMLSKKVGKKQYLVPYFISAFPGEEESDFRKISRWLAERGWRPQQVQEFIPSPGTPATAWWLGGVDEQGRPIKVNRSAAYRRKSREALSPGEPVYRKVENAYEKSTDRDRSKKVRSGKAEGGGAEKRSGPGAKQSPGRGVRGKGTEEQGGAGRRGKGRRGPK